eukprot:SAG11_NODE_5530_length_1533_cov_5.467225_1_plen_123_part_00
MPSPFVMWGGMASHTPPLSSVLGRPLALLERCLRALPNNFDPSDATQASNPLRWSYGSGDGAVITLVGVDRHRWEVSCLAVERRYERMLSLCAPTTFYLFLQPMLDQRTHVRSEDRPPCNAF